MHSPETKVACGSCRACCTNEMVVVMPEDERHLKHYQTVPHATLGLILATRPNGDCAHLTDAGCGIYKHRPAMCRTFSCVSMYAGSDSGVRDLRAITCAVFRAGKARFEAGRQAWIAAGHKHEGTK